MEVSTVQIYIQQFMQVLSDPMGLMVIVGVLGLSALVVVTDSARWYGLALALYAISCMTPVDKWISHAAFLAPLQFFRVWSRPVTFMVLLVLLASVLRYSRGGRHVLLPPSFWMFFAFQALASMRLIAVPRLIDRGLGGLMIVILLTCLAGLVFAPALQTMRDTNRLVWAIAGATMLYIFGTLAQYAANPPSVSHGGRLFGTTGNPVYAGFLLALSLPALCYLLVRRKQGLWVWLNLVILGTVIPLAVLMAIWTGSRGSAISALVGLIVFFHRRLGRLALAGAVCVAIGLVLAPYLSDAFGIVDRFFWSENTRAVVWARMWDSIRVNPWFGVIPDTVNVYAGTNTGEGSFLMSVSMYGVFGTIPLFLTFILLGYELQSIYRHRKVVPELTDLVDLLGGFWIALMVMAVFESFLLSYLTHTMLLVYVFFALEGYVLDRYRQALAGHEVAVPHEADQNPEYMNVAPI